MESAVTVPGHVAVELDLDRSQLEGLVQRLRAAAEATRCEVLQHNGLHVCISQHDTLLMLAW